MSVIQRAPSIGAGLANENIFAGSTFEFASSNMIVSLGIVGAAAGMFATVLAGSTTVLEESEIAVSADFPIVPDEMYYNFAMVQGDRLVVRIRNTTAGALLVRSIAQLQRV